MKKLFFKEFQTRAEAANWVNENMGMIDLVNVHESDHTEMKWNRDGSIIVVWYISYVEIKH